MTDFATLILGADTTGLKKGEAALTSIATTAGKTEARVSNSLAAAGGAMTRLGSSAVLSGFSMRGFTQQLSQVGQMGAVTGNYLGALAVQLPDIGLAFGAAGTIIGTIAGVALPTLISALVGTSAKAEEVKTKIEDLSSAAGAYVSASQAAGMSTDELAAKYGSLAGEAQKALAAMADVKLVQAIQATDEAIASLTDTIGKGYGRGASYASALIENFDMAAQSAGAVGDALRNLDDASGLQNQAIAANEVARQLFDAYGSVSAMPAPLQTVYGQMSEISLAAGDIQGATDSATTSIFEFASGASAAASALGGAVGQAYSLAGAAATAAQNIWASVSAMAAARVAQGALVGGGRGIGPQGVVGGGVSSEDPYGFRRTIRQVALVVPALGRVARAGGGAGKGISDGAREAAEALKATEDAAAKLKEEMERPLVTAIGSVSDAFGDFVARGFKDFKGFVRGILGSFQQMISQMISYALKNKIMISMGLGGSVAGTVAGAATGPIAGGGGGLLASLGGLGTAFSGGLSSVFMGLTTGGLSGGLGAIGTALSGATSGLAGLATAAGALVLPIAAIAGIFSFFKTKTKLLDAGLRVTTTNMSSFIETFQTINKKRFWGLSSKTRTTFDAAGAPVAGPIQNSIADIQNGVRDAARALGIGGAAFRGFAHTINISTKDLSQEQIQQKVVEALGGLGNAYAAMIPRLRRFAREGEGAMATLERLSNSLLVANTAFRSLGYAAFETSIAGAGAAARLVEAMGGLEKFGESVQFYFDNFYTLGERAREAARQFRVSLRDAGIRANAPRSIEQFRALVDRLMAAGRTVAAGRLMQLAPLFQQLLGLRAELASVGDVSERETRRLERLRAREEKSATDRENLQARIDVLTGNTVAIRRRELQGLDASNRARLREIWMLERQAAVASQREGLESQLLQLEGNTAEIRRRELAALFPGNREIQRRIFLLQDEAAAREAAAAIAGEREGLETRLLELQGNTAELRRRELAALDPTNRALQRMIWGLEDAQEAVQALNETDFATMFDYLAAQARASQPRLYQPPPASPAAMQARSDNVVSMARAKEAADMATMMKNGNALLQEIAISNKKVLDIEDRREVIGMPPVRP